MTSALWNAELAVLWRRDRCFRVNRSRRNPVVRDRLSAVRLVICRCSSGARILATTRIGVHVFPDDLPVRRDWKEPHFLPLVNERVAVRQPPRVADVRAAERPAGACRILSRVLPDDLLLDRVDFQNA